MIIRKFEVGDLDKIAIQAEQRHELENGAFFKTENCFTLVDGEEINGVFGFIEIYKGRVVVFSFISAKAGKHLLSLTKRLRKMIDDGMERTGTERVEMEVVSGFIHGERFAKLLGFECEGVMRKYYRGKDYKLYARVK